MAHDEGITNNSGNRPFVDVLETNLSRRKVLKGGLATAATMYFGGAATTALAGNYNWKQPLIEFTPVPVADGNGPVPNISADYKYDVIIPWGSPLKPSGPAFSWPPKPDDQARQIGIGHDGMWYFPIKDEERKRCGWEDDHDKWDDDRDWHYNTRRFNRGNRHGILCINHEFGTNFHVLGKNTSTSPPNNFDPANFPLTLSLGEVQASQYAHGVSVVELKKINGKWQNIESKRSRRIHVNSEVVFSGPAAGSESLETPCGNIPKGTVNNCSNGYTPWGTYLTCEENFNGYFGWLDPNYVPTEEQERYGFSSNGFSYGWHHFDPRFDLSNTDYTNEENRFGWVVEIDPMDPTQMPVKRTALGRCKHEGAAVTVGRGGRVVCYMGDDQRFDYIYKFVSAGNWRKMRRRGVSPLDKGKLYVARFNDDGTGDWLELTIDNPKLAARFSSQAEVLTYARIAADILGATPMDRPEWTSVAPNGDVFCTLTNSSRRTETGPGNPLAPNNDGHIIRMRDRNNHVGKRFKWKVILIAKDTHGTEESYSDPDGIWADPDGRLFIQTDGTQKDGLNNQMLVADTRTGELRRLFTGVTKDEITGIAITPDRRTMFINTQHPGNGDPSLTNFPAPIQDGVTIPRDCTFVITRRDGGIVGS